MPAGDIAMKVLVIGATGLVGWHVARRFAEEKVVRTGLKNIAPGVRPLDVRDAAAVSALVREVEPAVVIHAAADPNVEHCERDPQGTRAVNVDGVRNVAAAAEQVGARVAYFSSDYVFDGRASRPYIETDATSPLNEYGRQKVEAESIVLSEGGGLVCRVSGVFGWERGRRDCRNFVCQVVQRLTQGQEVRAAADQTLCPTYAPDIADVVWRLIGAQAAGIVHVVGPDAMSRADFAKAVAKAFGLAADRVQAVQSSELGLLATRPAFSALDTARLRRAGLRVPRPPRLALARMAKEAA